MNDSLTFLKSYLKWSSLICGIFTFIAFILVMFIFYHVFKNLGFI